MTSTTGRRPRRITSAVAGAALGIAGMTGSLLLLSQTAGADSDEPVVSEEFTGHDHAEFTDAEYEQWEEAWADFDACLADHGLLLEEDLESEDFDAEWDEEWVDGLPVVAVEAGDQLTFVDFGEGDGTVTIEKTGDEITVSTTGDATQESIDLSDELVAMEAEAEQWDEAVEACEHLAPEDGLDFDEDYFDDEGHLDNEDDDE